MYFRVNLKMKKLTLCFCFTWVPFIELHCCIFINRANLGWRLLGNIVCTPFPFLLGKGVFKKKGSKRSQFLQGGCWEPLFFWSGGCGGGGGPLVFWGGGGGGGGGGGSVFT